MKTNVLVFLLLSLSLQLFGQTFTFTAQEARDLTLKMLDNIQTRMVEDSRKNMVKRTFSVTSLIEFIEKIISQVRLVR